MKANAQNRPHVRPPVDRARRIAAARTQHARAAARAAKRYAL
jgi:hypothetical protein